ncbi:hypothetical protein RS75_23690 [Rhizobium nepotum 39/7]|uniref:(2Fe-2S)-binding protein n=1 Tax=Rhizobium nepotum 39/7 TaxID=1368418 RepID=A0ABR5CKF1_9HYPH|nr:hypothetical protein RS75_23690 [Rhizobium nepotum 39/7]
MFRRIDRKTTLNDACDVTFVWEGVTLIGKAGDTVAAALLAAGVNHTRAHPVTGEPRTAYCMMGVCFECLVAIDGIPNRQACQTRLRDGMRVDLQRGARK